LKNILNIYLGAGSLI